MLSANRLVRRVRRAALATYEYACERVRDYDREAQWCRRVEELADRLRIPQLLGQCRTHYGGLLTWRGDWREAEEQLSRAAEDFAASRPIAVVDSVARLAELRRRQGRLDEAERLFEDVEGHVLAVVGQAQLALDGGDAWRAAELAERTLPLSEQDFDLAGIDIVVNPHLHGDHCGGNHLFADKPIYVQRRELDEARSQDDYTIREWVDAPGVRYVPVDGELELLPRVRLVPAPGHTRGTQVVVVETGRRPVVVCGDVAVWFGELDEPHRRPGVSAGCGDQTRWSVGSSSTKSRPGLPGESSRVPIASPSS